jgi:homoserine dehydrogenase
LKALIIGNGQVGRAVARQLSGIVDRTSFFGSKDDPSQLKNRVLESDVIFVSISTRDTGESALSYLLEGVCSGKPVITCEKGALAYHFEMLKPHLSRIGYSATVGGASGMLSLFHYPRTGLKRVVGIVNGTLNFLSSECTLGKSPYSVLAEALRLGLCEPGSNSLARVVNAEIKDVLLKTAIILNFAGILQETTKPTLFGDLLVSEEEAVRQLANRQVRFAVVIEKSHYSPHRDVLYDCLRVVRGGWQVRVGFMPVSSLSLRHLPSKQQNALMIEDRGGCTEIFGTGAGPTPTAAAMIGDALTLMA